MKINALFILALLGLAGCSTSYKGAIKASNTGEEQKRETYISSHSTVTDYGLSVNK